MKIYNRHDRPLNTSPEDLSWVIDTLPEPGRDPLWPHENWPPRVIAQPLRVGSAASHANGRVPYTVAEYLPGKRIAFRMEESGATAGLDGRHFFEIVPRRTCTLVRHVVDADCDLKMFIRWFLFIRPVHNAIIEDALDKVENKVNKNSARKPRWSLWVKFLRWLRRAPRATRA